MKTKDDPKMLIGEVQILRIRVATAEVTALNHINTSNPRPQFVTL